MVQFTKEMNPEKLLTDYAYCRDQFCPLNRECKRYNTAARLSTDMIWWTSGSYNKKTNSCVLFEEK